MKKILKQTILFSIKVSSIIISWLTLPFYAKRNSLAVRRSGKRPLIISKHTGIFNGIEEKERTLYKIIKILEELKIDFFLVPHLDRKIGVAVINKNRRSVLSALGKNKEFEGYYVKVLKDKHNTNIDRLISRGFLKNYDSIQALDVYRHVSIKNTRTVLGYDFAVSLEFWGESDSLPKHLFSRAMNEAGIMDKGAMGGSLVAPTANGVAKVFSKKEQVFKEYFFGSIKSKTMSIFTEKMLGQVNFPIDVVYTWVDGDDPEWRSSFQGAKKKLDPNYNNNSMSRYTDHDELRYSLRSIEMYAPWVNNIYIVTHNQVPGWLKQDSKIKIVDHRDIFNDTHDLPVFNSHAIESQLHHIKGLSEHFLYLNDDMFFTNHTVPETFFCPNGLARLLPSSATVGTGLPSKGETAPSSAGKNVRRLIDAQFGVLVTSKFRHAPNPQMRSVSYEIEDKFPAEIDRTMRSKFRSGSDISFTSSLSQNYLLASSNGVPYPYKTTTIDISNIYAEQQIREILAHNESQTVCLNESNTVDGQEGLVSERALYFLDNYFPYPSRWEN